MDPTHPARSEIMEHVMRCGRGRHRLCLSACSPEDEDDPQYYFLTGHPHMANPTASSSCLLRWPSPSFPHFPLAISLTRGQSHVCDHLHAAGEGRGYLRGGGGGGGGGGNQGAAPLHIQVRVWVQIGTGMQG